MTGPSEDAEEKYPQPTAPAWYRRTVVVTGGTRGLGRAISLRYAEPSTLLVLNYANDDAAARKVAAEVESQGARAVLIKGDIGERRTAEALVSAAVESSGHIDVLVHNAFHRTWHDPLDLDLPELEAAFRVGPIAVALAAQVAAGHFSNSGGSIICTSSLATTRIFSIRGGVGYFPMAAAKGALEVTVRYLAARLGASNVRVNGVSAGWIDTAAEVRPDVARAIDRIVRRTPLGRIASTADIADVVYALSTHDMRWVSGQVLVADGGLSII
jgi:NAD(P)-dependent dehydrogenase (short-subunit alcohol dehydrogenase family)